MAPLRVCVVGLGRAGQFHMQSLEMMGRDVELAWAVDVRPEAVKPVVERYGCKGTDRLEEALADQDLDAVVVASTTHQHAKHIQLSLAADKAVFTEKPISHDPEEIAAILATVRAKKLVFRVGFQRRHDRHFRELKQQLDAGVIGGPRIIHSTSRDNPEPSMEYLAISGGIFHDMLCHDVDMLNFVTGETPVDVYAVGKAYNPKIAAMGDVDTAVMTLTFPSGVIATVDTSRISAYGYDQRLEVFGERGMLQVTNPPTHAVTTSTVSGLATAPSSFSFPQRYERTYKEGLEAFVNAVRDGSLMAEAELQWLVDIERVMTAGSFSLKLGRKVAVSEVEELRTSHK